MELTRPSPGLYPTGTTPPMGGGVKAFDFVVQEEKRMNFIHRNFLRFSIVALVVVTAAVVTTQGVAAQQPPPSDDQVNGVAHQLYCPVCENTPLDVCPTQACAQWRELIREKLSQGWSDQQIKDYFAAQYGPRVLAEPLRSGLNWLVYLLPPAVFLLGAYLVFRVMRSARRRQTVNAAPAANQLSDDPYLRRLEEQLRQKKE